MKRCQGLMIHGDGQRGRRVGVVDRLLTFPKDPTRRVLPELCFLFKDYRIIFDDLFIVFIFSYKI